MAEFIHLHTHSHFSLLDGCCSIDGLVRRAVSLGMPALALTDHGVMHGAVSFYQTAKAHGLRPIIGCEVYVAPGGRTSRSGRAEGSPAHLTVLAADLQGYRNLMRLSTLGFTEGFYYKPRVDKELLTRHGEGLIVLSGCAAGEVPRLLQEERDGDARTVAGEYAEMFPGRYYIELQDQGVPGQGELNRRLVDLADRLDLPVVATNDVHYLTRVDAPTHDVLLAIQTGKTLSDPDRLRFPSDQFYLKSPAEMAVQFGELPAALSNTVAIAERCELALALGKLQMPAFPKADQSDPGTYLEQLAMEGAARRFSEVSPAVRERLQHELQVIRNTGYPGYFLIVWDLVRFARQAGIAVGPGRGTAVSSLVAYCLEITDIDPLQYGLVFERFLNPERVSPPDIDIDFCYERRGEMLDYVTRTYGRDRVAMIATFGTMAARAAIRDVGRALEIPYGDVDALAKRVPADPGMTLSQALESVPELRNASQGDEGVQQWVAMAQALEGTPRHLSVHAAGVVISDDHLVEKVPLATTQDDVPVTQYPMGDVEAVGLLKMDFLGLRTLTVISKAREQLQARGEALDLKGLPLDDAAVYAMLSRGDAAGVFQLETRMFRDLLRRVRPECFEDLIALVALGRPGPMGRLDNYIRRKHGEEAVTYPLPALEPILQETYGVMIYQEQVMRIAMDLAGYTAGQADLLRRGMGKKLPEVIAAEQERFVGQAVERGVPREVAGEIFAEMERFAGYGFNKSHSAAYGLVAYWTAYLKAHYPVVFMAAQLSSVMGNTDRVARYVEECRHEGIRVLPPDVNNSEASFVSDDEGIRYGLGAIRNVGVAAAAAVVAARQDGPFTSLDNFCQRVDARHSHLKMVESLIKAGAFDGLGGRRAQLLAMLPQSLDAGHRRQQEQVSGQGSLFAETGAAAEGLSWSASLPDVEEFPAHRMLQMEKEVLGLYVSGHPLEAWQRWLQDWVGMSPADAADLPAGRTVAVAGAVEHVRQVVTRGGERMAFVQLEDARGTAETIFWPRVWQALGSQVEEGAVLIVRGKLESRSGEAQLVAEETLVLDPDQPPLLVRFSGNDTTSSQGVRAVLQAAPGPTPVLLTWETAAVRVVAVADRRWWTQVDAALIQKLNDIPGVAAQLATPGARR